MVKFLKHSVQPLDDKNLSKVPAEFTLNVVQQPVKARVAGRKQTRNSSRRLVDPQPVIEIRLDDTQKNVIDHSLSMFFVRATIECIGASGKESFFQKQRKSRYFDNQKDLSDNNEEEEVLRGTTTVSAQFYRGSPYIACAVFDNLSVRYKGSYRLRFDLFEIQSFHKDGTGIPRIVKWEKSTQYSNMFTVYTDAAFDGLEASPELNNELKKAGCKIRARKQRSMLTDGFKVTKATNHFGLDRDLMFNRPNSAMDFGVMDLQQQMGIHIKRPQTALPQLITTHQGHFDYDMLRSGSTEYSASPIEQPQPKRPFSASVASVPPMFSDMNLSIKRATEDFVSPVVYQNEFSNMNFSDQFNDQYTAANLMMTNNTQLNGSPLSNQVVAAELMDHAKVDGVYDIPRSTLPLESIPMSWDYNQQYQAQPQQQQQQQQELQQQDQYGQAVDLHPEMLNDIYQQTDMMLLRQNFQI